MGKQVVNNNIPGHPPWHQQLSYIKHAVVYHVVTGNKLQMLQYQIQVLPADRLLDNFRKNIN